MLEIKRIREQPEAVRAGLQRRGVSPETLERVLALDQVRREALARAERCKQERNQKSKTIGQRRKQGEDTTAEQAEVRELGETISTLDTEIRSLDAQLSEALRLIPNIPQAAAPTGADATGNRVVREVGTPPTFAFTPQDHIALGEALGIFDFARAARLSGAGFPVLLGQGARLQRGLIQFMLDLHVEQHGYTEIMPPFVVHSDAMTGTGQLPKMADDMYYCERDDLWLIPTAEVPVTNFFREEIIERPLPIRMTAYTPCFRREAGAAGRDTRGLIRVHQFDKVEMVQWTHPDDSAAALETLVGHAEAVLRALALPYRVLELCTGDLSFAAARCYDIELWAPGQNDWLEVSSCSNFEDFQARRAGIRFRDADGAVRHPHTLNGSGVALPRLMVALLENGQQADGSVQLPPALHPYLGGIERLTPGA